MILPIILKCITYFSNVKFLYGQNLFLVLEIIHYNLCCVFCSISYVSITYRDFIQNKAISNIQIFIENIIFFQMD